MIVQTVLTGLIFAGALAYLGFYFRPRRKRVTTASSCGGCQGQMGCCGKTQQSGRSH